MSKLFVIRHGQANFHGDNYDQLSPIGHEQARLLGIWFADLGWSWDHVVYGPKQRHRETMEAVASVYRERSIPWPQPVMMPEFDEHRGAGVTVGYLKEHNEMPDRSNPDGVKQYFRRFEEITRLWTVGKLESPEFESWQEFRQRVTSGLDKIRTDCRGNVALFTSGGPVALATGLSLELEDPVPMELSWKVRNCAWSEFLYSGDRFSLTGFNVIPHLGEPRLHTYI